MRFAERLAAAMARKPSARESALHHGRGALVYIKRGDAEKAAACARLAARAARAALAEKE